jgi:hypothetical protein
LTVHGLRSNRGQFSGETNCPQGILHESVEIARVDPSRTRKAMESPLTEPTWKRIRCAQMKKPPRLVRRINDCPPWRIAWKAVEIAGIVNDTEKKRGNRHYLSICDKMDMETACVCTDEEGIGVGEAGKLITLMKNHMKAAEIARVCQSHGREKSDGIASACPIGNQMNSDTAHLCTIEEGIEAWKAGSQCLLWHLAWMPLKSLSRSDRDTDNWKAIESPLLVHSRPNP